VQLQLQEVAEREVRDAPEPREALLQVEQQRAGVRRDEVHKPLAGDLR
jgi:hypothetical protein